MTYLAVKVLNSQLLHIPVPPGSCLHRVTERLPRDVRVSSEQGPRKAIPQRTLAKKPTECPTVCHNLETPCGNYERVILYDGDYTGFTNKCVTSRAHEAEVFLIK